MAALINHVLSKNHQILAISSLRNLDFAQKRYYPKKNYKQKIPKVEVPKCRKLQSTQESVAARGFLRCQKEYEPKENYEKELKTIYNSVVGDESQDISHSVKFELFNECFKRFNHSVPNSILHTIKRYDDLLAFYGTPVSEVLPLDKLKSIDLPPNLHIQYEPLRFHPDDDTMFKGQTAFPKSNTLVTGIRTRKKYKGCKVVDSWPEAY
ncbi:39S ribosomal protein L50, mitochondrial [Cimex lectularius]|uniref:Large ribosomal subunit protein mL50 n=1 Tax=Cimex lectularius TaxID=79782 RepID=A0A8I6TCW6_CIMLE|nr:39S ribosomal protein L50, mitochondrial [Cimex lectularius]